MDLASSPDALLAAGAAPINFAQRDSLILVKPGGVILLDGVVEQGQPPVLPWQTRVRPENAPSGIALEPAVLFSPGSTVSASQVAKPLAVPALCAVSSI